MSRSWKDFEGQARKSLDCLEETLGRNTVVQGDSGENSGQSARTHTHTHTHTEYYVVTEAEMGLMLIETKELRGHQKREETREEPS